MPNRVATFVTTKIQLALLWTGRTLRSLALWPTYTPTRLLCWNFVSLILLGVAFSGWLLYFTDSFEVFGGLLALGGLFSWLAFVSKIFPEDKTKEIKQGLFWLLLEGPFAWAIYLGILALGALVTSTAGAIQLDSVQGAADYQVVIHPDGPKKGDEPERLPATGRVRFVRLLPWWQAQRYKVRVVGFPEQDVTLRPWWDRQTRKVPFAFVRPVVLVGAEKTLIKQSRTKDEIIMTITIGDNDFELKERYRGEAIWIGCRDEDGIAVPARAQEWWKDALTDPNLAPLLLNPRPMEKLIKDEDREAWDGLPTDLTSVKVRARLNWKEDAKELFGESPVISVSPARTPQDMVQLLWITKPSR